MMRRGLSLVLLLVALPALSQDDDFSFEIMDAEVKEEDAGLYDAAKTLLDQERYSEALAAYEDILKNEESADFHPDAQYDTAKALYRMGLFHAALDRYGVILEAGPKHKHFERAREWLFFLARQMGDTQAVVAQIAAYAKPDELPAENKNEFNYQLARYFFERSLEEGAKGVAVEDVTGDADEGGFDFGEEGSLDDPSLEEDADDDAGEDEPASTDPLDFNPEDIEDRTEDPPSDDGGEGDFGEEGFDFSDDELGGGDDDGFDFDFGDVETTPKKKKKKKSRKRTRRSKKKKKKAKATDSAGDTPAKSDSSSTAEPSSIEKAAKELEAAQEKANAGAHKNENPQTAEEQLQRALGYANDVGEDFPLYVKNLYLQGLIHFALGEFEPAVKAFRQVVRTTHPENGTISAPKLREMAFFSLARIHYQFQQFRYAIFYYERIDRDSERWLDALFESSWAHFRLAEYERSLGNLVTIQSPFFVDEYYPESHILKAITFYENCRYPEARAFLDEFKSRYDGVIEELDRLVTAERSDAEFYKELTSLEQKVQSGQDDDVRSKAATARLLRLALSDRRLGKYRGALDEIESELKALEAISAPYAGAEGHQALIQAVSTRQLELTSGVGGLLKQKLSSERKFLRDLQAKLVRIQFEITKQEKEGLEAQLKGEGQTLGVDAYRLTTATDDERVYWPFNGEYWRDELGTYRYTLMRGCRPPDETRVD